MKKLLFTLSALAAACTLASSAPAFAAAARNYDCSKPGNANKAACKNAAKAKPAAKAAAAPKAKAAPKPAAATKPAAKAKPVAANDRHYDCSKAGNANKAACKRAAAAAAKPAPKPAASPAAMPKAAPSAKSSENNVAAGAIAQCKDGTYSHAKQHRGACSRHGGVGKWLG